MNKFLKLLSIMLVMANSVSSQSAKDVFVGLNSDLTNSRVSDLSLSPNVGYMVNDNFMVSANVRWTDSDGSSYSFLGATVRYYNSNLNLKSTVSTFLEGSLGTSFSDDDTTFGIGVGLNAWLSSKFYLEPKLSLATIHSEVGGNYTDLGFQIGAGFRF